MNVEEFKTRFEKMQKADNEMFAIAEQNIQSIINENYRVAEIAHNAQEILEKLDKEFEEETGLNNIDVAVMMLAVGLQIVRQYLLSNEKCRITAKQGDAMVKKPIKKVFPNTADILTSSVPYDAVKTSDLFNYSTGISGTTHRYRTLGHDPIFGWIIGPANIMTNSLTKYNFDTYAISGNKILRRYDLNFPGMMNDFVELSINHPDRLALSIVKQAIHFGSDYFTKQGLPLPFIATVDNELAKQMVAKWNIDMYSVTRGASISALINEVIKILHKLFFDSNAMDEKLYEVKTRKVLLYSNLIASSSNVAVVAITNNMSKLDVGGLCVTIYRLINDKKFISEMKKEFVYGKFHDMIMGNKLELVEYTYQELLEKYMNE